MLFIIILFLTAFSIAGSAAFFSVYGLANTFHGTFWAVVLMGGSLEVGKLVAASYLYRYWKATQFILKSYLMIGVLALMMLTSTGIFGYLSTGYMTDTLPLKQIQQQISLLDEEKGRLVERKKQIDAQIANLPADYSKSRIKLMNSFKSEQETTTTRVATLDQEILKLKTSEIQTEAHIGPITYIAKALSLDTDNATKYLIYLIIFVFDPMAVALTLAVNIAIRERQTQRIKPHEDVSLDMFEPIPSYNQPAPPMDTVSYSVHIQEPKRTAEEQPIEEQPIEEQPYVQPPPRRVRPYSGVDSSAPIARLLEQHQYYLNKEAQGDVLTQDERWAQSATKDALHKQGYNIYI